MKILYIHGHNGSPDGEKSAMIRRQFPDAEMSQRLATGRAISPVPE